MPRKNQITNQPQDQQKIFEAQVSKSRKSHNQSVDAGASDQFPDFEHRRPAGRYLVLRPGNEVSPCTTESSELTTIVKPAAMPYRSSKDSSLRVREEGGERIIVTGAFPPSHLKPGELVEIIRDPENPGRMVFLHWENGSATIADSIECEGRIFVPPDPMSRSFPSLSLPMGLLPCGDPSEVLGEAKDAISRFVTLPFQQRQIVAASVIASWFPDCFEAAPHLWIVGPLGSGKTKLLKVLWCMCRRGLIAGDLRPGSIYKLIDTWNPTLMIDELDLGGSVASRELLRMLRAGSAPAAPTFRNGRQFSTYGLKIIASRQPVSDAALLSRGLVISMLPATDDTPPLDGAAMDALEREWQPKLCMFRLQNFERVKNNCHSTNRLRGLSGRMKQIGLALTAPFGEHHACLSTLHGILNEHDDENQIERSLEPEWLAAEVLLEQYHERSKNERFEPEILVGEVAAHMNEKLGKQSEHVRFSAKKVGLILRSLGIYTTRLGRAGRGLTFSHGLDRDIHEIASQLGMFQWNVAQSKESPGDPKCRICEDYRPHR